jgi:D-apionolactonase
MSSAKLPRHVLYYGTDAPPPAQIALRAGRLSLIYESGDLRYIRLGQREILRRVYVALRDRNWGTVLPVLSNVQIEQTDDSFQISYDVEHRQGQIDFFWRGSIVGDARGTISFTIDGVARSSFLRNRIGFCVLHPIHECAGVPCHVEHVDGTIETTRFPHYIAPQALVDGIIHPVYPFAELRAMSHEVQPGVWAVVRFEGETFEMEDQRNWTDASFKTYGTPLRLPFPAKVARGTRIRQSVTLALNDEGRMMNDEGRTKIVDRSSFSVHRSAKAVPLPQIGLGVASHGQSLSERELDRLRALNLAHLRVDLNLASADYSALLRQASRQARALGVSLEVALTLSDVAADELAALLGVLPEIKPPVSVWLIFHVSEHSAGAGWVQLARERLAGYYPAALIGGGTNANFTELNRARPSLDALDLVCYSINPQVHAFDNASLAETLAAQAVTVASARQFAGALPLAITPVTLLPRFNPNATAPDPAPAPGELPRQVDVRQMSLFGAGWTTGSLKYLCESGAASLTYYETSGWRGVIEQERGSPLPDRFRSLPGGVFPLYHVLADVGEFAGGEVIPSESSAPLRVEGLILRKGTATRIILASLIATRQRVRIQHGGRSARVRLLDERNAEAAMRDPQAFRAQAGELLDTPDGSIVLELLPYAIARIDVFEAKLM